MNPEKFTLEYFKKIIDTLKQKGFSFCHFKEGNLSAKKIFLRHDVDFCVDIAHKFADFESKLGICSTYFVMLDTPLYNIFHTETCGKLKDILALGHDIGLHFVLEGTAEPAVLQDKIEKQCQILEERLRHPIQAYSFHRPAFWEGEGFKSSMISLSKRNNTYRTPFCIEGHYISDSNHNWRCGDPIEFINNHQSETLQLLTHPIWWTKSPMKPTDKIETFFIKPQLSFH